MSHSPQTPRLDLGDYDRNKYAAERRHKAAHVDPA
jgi:hypothetical protein